LKLVLSTYGKMHVGAFSEPSSAIVELFQLGDGYKAALLSNSRIDYYGFDKRIDYLLKDVILCNSDSKEARSLRLVLVKNPRANRELIAKAMRGAEGFERLSWGHRLAIGAEAIAVKEIPAENWLGKDSPDTHETYFSEPHNAFLPLLKEAKQSLPEKDFQAHLSEIIWKMVDAQLDVKAKDWVPAEEIKRFNHDTYMEDIREANLKALEEVFSFFSDWYDRDDGLPQEYKHICRVGTAILSIDALLNNYWIRESVQDVVDKLLAHPSTILKAAGYAKIFNSIELDDECKGIKDFFAAYPEDTLEKWMGISCTEAFWLCRGNYKISDFISWKMDASGYQVRIENAEKEVYQYLFGTDIEFERSARVKAHNDKIKFIKLKPKNVVTSTIKKAFSVDDGKLKQAVQDSKGLLGKLFS
jgi:hypothetical protein